MIRIKLKDILKEKNMTMTELHQKTGITQKALSLFANHKSNGVQYGTLEKIIKTLDIEISDLIEFSEDIFKIIIKKSENDTIENSYIKTSYTLQFKSVTRNKIEHELTFVFFIKWIKNRSHANVVYIELEPNYLNDTDIKINKILRSELYNGDKSELLKVISYIIVNQIIKDYKDLEVALQTVVILFWKGLLPTFYLKQNEESNLDKEIVYTEMIQHVRLAPQDITMDELDLLTGNVDSIIASFTDLMNLSIVHKIDFDEENSSPQIYVTLD